MENDGMDVLTEYRIEEIRKYLSKYFNREHSRYDAVSIIVSHFYNDYLEEIEKSKKE